MGANLVLNRFTDASSSVFPYQPAKAVDGVLTPLKRWVGSSPLPPSGTPAPVWLRVDLGTTYWVNRWVVKQMGAVGWSSKFNLIDYKLQGSTDNANWFDMDLVTNNSVNQTDRTCASKKIRWIRIYITKGLGCNTNFASIEDLEIYEAANAPYLTGLTVQNGTVNVSLAPAFSNKTYFYSGNVDSGVGQVSITPTAMQSNATIRVNNITVQSGQPSPAINLNMGNNSIPVTVTTVDGTDTYTVNITRASSNQSAYLTSLVFTARGGMMTPDFTKTNFSYTANVASNATSATVTPTAEDPTSTITVNGNVVQSGNESGPITLNQGQTTITLIVRSGSIQQTYTIAVTKP